MLIVDDSGTNRKMMLRLFKDKFGHIDEAVDGTFIHSFIHSFSLFIYLFYSV